MHCSDNQPITRHSGPCRRPLLSSGACVGLKGLSLGGQSKYLHQLNLCDFSVFPVLSRRPAKYFVRLESGSPLRQLCKVCHPPSMCASGCRWLATTCSDIARGRVVQRQVVVAGSRSSHVTWCVDDSGCRNLVLRRKPAKTSQARGQPI